MGTTYHRAGQTYGRAGQTYDRAGQMCECWGHINGWSYYERSLARAPQSTYAYADFANTHARVLDNWCKFCLLIMGILSYCTFHRVYVQIAETEVHSRS